MPPGLTINATAYCDTLTRLRRAIQNKRRGMLSRSVCLLHEKARLHSPHVNTALLEKFKWDLLDHPSYSPKFAPSDFHRRQTSMTRGCNRKYTGDVSLPKLSRDNSVLYFTCILKLVFGMVVLTHFLSLGFNERTCKVWVNKVDTTGTHLPYCVKTCLLLLEN